MKVFSYIKQHMHAMHAEALAPTISKILQKWLDYAILHVHIDFKAKYQGHWMTLGWDLSSKAGQICDSLTQCYGVREAGKARQEICSLTHSVWSMGHGLIIKLIDSFAHSQDNIIAHKIWCFAATNFKRSGVKHAVKGTLSFQRRMLR